MLRAIAAVSADGGLGRNGQLLFHIAEDLRRFKDLTTGKAVIMGRATLDSLPGGRPLPNRRNLVLTRNKSFQRPGVEVFHSPEELLRALGEADGWVIGGAEVYALLLPLCRELYLTRVEAAPDADRFFPALGAEWTLREDSGPRTGRGLTWRFLRYEWAEMCQET